MYFPRGTGSVVGSKSEGGAAGAAGGKGPAATQPPKGKEPASSKGPAATDPNAGTGGASTNAAGPGTTPADGANPQAAHEPGFIELVAQDPDGKPYAGAKFRVVVEAGPPIEGTLDDKGFARVEGVGKKSCTVSFPELNPE